MIYQATQDISNYFTMKAIPHRIEEAAGHSRVEVTFNGKVVKGAVIMFISANDQSDVSVRVPNFGSVTVPDDRHFEVLEELNRLNGKYRHIKFCLQPDNSIIAMYEIPASFPMESIGEGARELFVRMVQMLDEAYPAVMKVVWG